MDQCEYGNSLHHLEDPKRASERVNPFYTRTFFPSYNFPSSSTTILTLTNNQAQRSNPCTKIWVFLACLSLAQPHLGVTRGLLGFLTSVAHWVHSHEGCLFHSWIKAGHLGDSSMCCGYLSRLGAFFPLVKLTIMYGKSLISTHPFCTSLSIQ